MHRGLESATLAQSISLSGAAGLFYSGLPWRNPRRKDFFERGRLGEVAPNAAGRLASPWELSSSYVFRRSIVPEFVGAGGARGTARAIPPCFAGLARLPREHPCLNWHPSEYSPYNARRRFDDNAVVVAVAVAAS